MWYCKFCDIKIDDGDLRIISCYPYELYDEIQVCPNCYDNSDLEYLKEE